MTCFQNNYTFEIIVCTFIQQISLRFDFYDSHSTSFRDIIFNKTCFLLLSSFPFSGGACPDFNFWKHYARVLCFKILTTLHDLGRVA